MQKRTKCDRLWNTRVSRNGKTVELQGSGDRTGIVSYSLGKTVAQLEALSKAFDVLHVSGVIIIEPDKDLGVDSNELLAECNRRCLGTTPLERIREAFIYYLHCYHRWKCSSEVTDMGMLSNIVEGSISEAIRASFRDSLKTMKHTIIGCAFADIYLDLTGYGRRTYFHPHAMALCNSSMVFGTRSSSWNCCKCSTAMSRDIPVYFCAMCNFYVCVECFTSVPNNHSESTQHKIVLPQLKLQGLLQKVFTAPLDQFNVRIPVAFAQTLRKRLLSLPTNSRHYLPVLNALNDLIGAVHVQMALIYSEEWIPTFMNGKKMALESFLGPFFRLSTLPDKYCGEDLFRHTSQKKPQEIEELSTALRDYIVRAQDVLAKIIKTLITSEGLVKQATYSWLATAIHVNSMRRRLAGESLEWTADGFLLNVSAVMLQLVIPLLAANPYNRIDSNYHAYDFNGHYRIDFSNEARMLPCSEHGNAASTTNPATSRCSYYPSWGMHEGMICDHCKRNYLSIVRYKCANCADYDLCVDCFMFSMACSSNSLEGPVHDLSHTFLRILCPVPYIPNWKFSPVPVFSTSSQSNTAPLNARRHEGVRCSTCREMPIIGIRYKCSSCDQNRCQKCLHEEEKRAVVKSPYVKRRHAGYTIYNPYEFHAPGHVYYVITTPLPCNLSICLLPKLLYAQAILPQETFNDTTELFYLCLRVLYVGPLLSAMRYTSISHEFQQLKTMFSSDDRSRHSIRRRTLEIEGRLELLMKTKLAVEIHLFETVFINRIYEFYKHVAEWILDLISTHAREECMMDEKNVNPLFASLPEHIIVDISQTIESIATHLVGIKSNGFTDEQLEPIVTVMVQVIGCQTLSSNPHVRMALASSMIAISPFPSAVGAKLPVIYTVLDKNAFLQRYAVSCFTRLYADMQPHRENGDGADLLSIRLGISLLLRLLWTKPLHRKRFIELCRDSSQFSMFLSGALTDSMRLLEDLVSKIASIKRLETSPLPSGSFTSALFHSARSQQHVKSMFKQARLHFRLIMECLEFLVWASGNTCTREALLRPELVNHTAVTLNMFMSVLGRELRPQGWGFSQELHQDGVLTLAQIIIIYVRCANLDQECPDSTCWKLSNHAGIRLEEGVVNLELQQRWRLSSSLFRIASEMESSSLPLSVSDQKVQENSAHSFVIAIVEDARFYDSLAFKHCLHVVKSEPSLHVNWVSQFRSALADFETIKQMREEMEEKLGDIPDEYIDPIMQTLMSDPVMLPSGHIMDRWVIERYLLANPLNPFSREYLSKDMLVPSVELREKINAYVVAKLKEGSLSSYSSKSSLQEEEN